MLTRPRAQHFYYFVQEFKLVDPKELEPLVSVVWYGFLYGF
jgi:hypothetical protein